jgi:hypothetical protein
VLYIYECTASNSRVLLKVSCVVASEGRIVKVKLAVGHTEADILASETNWNGNIW